MKLLRDLCIALTLSCILSQIATAQRRLFRGFPIKRKTNVERLAHAMDKVEAEIDTLGSVVIKQPDVWGEARWTKHRAEFEETLAAELRNFKFTVNAKISESDTAFLFQAMALGNSFRERRTTTGVGDTASTTVVAGSPVPAPFTPRTGGFVQASSTTVLTPDGKTELKGVAIEPVLFLDQMSRYVKHLHQLRRINEGDDTADAPGYALNLMRIPVSVLPGTKTRAGYGAEVNLTLTPELGNELLPETFRDLVINDLVDQLALPILKVSEQNNLRTQAVSDTVSFEYRTYVSLVRELNAALAIAKRTGRYPDTWVATLEKVELLFSSKVFDAAYLSSPQPGYPLEAWPDIVGMRQRVRRQLDTSFSVVGDFDWLVGELKKKNLSIAATSPEDLKKAFESDQPGDLADLAKSLEVLQITGLLPETNGTWLRSSASEYRQRYDRQIRDSTQLLATLEDEKKESEVARRSTLIAKRDAAKKIEDLPTPARISEILDAVRGQLTGKVGGVQPLLGLAPSPRSRRARYAVAPTEVIPVFGEENILAIGAAVRGFQNSSSSKHLHLMDVQAILREQLNAAYQYLSMPAQAQLWQLCPSISMSVRQLDYGQENSIELSRASFEEIATPYRAIGAAQQGDSIRALAWAILVESALLNDRLFEDIQRIERDKACQILSQHQPSFFGPNPPAEARQMFNEYVRERWPIHVFAIDPENQDQNVADAFARRREAQLAASLAFTRGEISADTFTQFARRLDFELETVSLNRTVVGFSHGNDTFGWRMYPRVQAPPIQGNLKVAVRDLLIGGPSRDRDLQARQLEPGPREMLAVVIMPSFVPFCRMDVRTNWFELTEPDKKQFDMEDSVRIGQMIQELRYFRARCLKEAPRTRPGDLARILQAADQLERRLPLQEARIQVPYENSQGGFQLFANGTQHLGPELIGYYGEPGVDKAKGTTMFLVGRNLNVNVTEVIIGGSLVQSQLLSREIVRVTVPKDVQTTSAELYNSATSKYESVEVVDAHIATPSGVSSHLYIPVVAGAAKAPAKPAFDPARINGCLTFNGCVAENVQLSQPVLKITGLPKGLSVTEVAAKVTAHSPTGVTESMTIDIGGKPLATVKYKGGWPSTDAKGEWKISERNLGGIVGKFLSGNHRLLANDDIIYLTVDLAVQGNAVESLTIVLGDSCPCPPAAVPSVRPDAVTPVAPTARRTPWGRDRTVQRAGLRVPR